MYIDCDSRAEAIAGYGAADDAAAARARARAGEGRMIEINERGGCWCPGAQAQRPARKIYPVRGDPACRVQQSSSQVDPDPRGGWTGSWSLSF